MKDLLNPASLQWAVWVWVKDKQVMSHSQPVAFPAKDNRRKHERSAVSLDGRLFVPAEESEQPCRVVDLSAGGACVICADVPPPSTFVILYVDGFGRFPAVTTRFSDGVIALRFDMTAKQSKKLTGQISSFLKSGITGATSLRRHGRMASAGEGKFRRANGAEVACSIRDLSLKGAFLETGSRPPLGEVISIGPFTGAVIRHETDGIAIQFVAGRDRKQERSGKR